MKTFTISRDLSRSLDHSQLKVEVSVRVWLIGVRSPKERLNMMLEEVGRLALERDLKL